MESSKLQEYCLLAKGSKGRMLVDIIQRATSDPTLFAFGELLVVPTVEQVDRSEFVYTSSSSTRVLKPLPCVASRHRSWGSLQNSEAIRVWHVELVPRCEHAPFTAGMADHSCLEV